MVVIGKKPFEHFELNLVTDLEDDFSREYSAKMTSCCQKFNYKLKLTFRTFYECEFFHGPSDSLKCRDIQYNSPSKLLKSEFPQDSILGGSKKEIPVDQLLKRILEDDPDYSGFIALQGGAEQIEDVAKMCQGFTLVKTKPTFEALGPLALKIVCQRWGENEEEGKKRLREMCSRSQLTIAKQSLGSEEVLVWTTGLLRWMIKNRQFGGFQILHFVRYSKRNYLRSWLEEFLQKRHLVKRKEASSLESATLKLIINR